MIGRALAILIVSVAAGVMAGYGTAVLMGLVS